MGEHLVRLRTVTATRLWLLAVVALGVAASRGEADGGKHMLVFGQDVLATEAAAAGPRPSGLAVYAGGKAVVEKGEVRLDVFARNDTDQELSLFFTRFPAHPAWSLCSAQLEGEGISVLSGPQGPEVYDAMGRPPGFVKVAVPARATLQFVASVPLSSVEYRGQPQATLRWSLRFADSPASGTVQVTLPQAPLQVAAKNGWREDVVRAVEQGVDVNATDAFGNTALQVACDQDQLEIVQLLLQKHAKVGRAIFGAAANGHARVLEALLRAGTPAEVRDDEQKTPLHWAAVNGHAEAVKVLVQHGANPRAKDKWGHTPAELAANLPADDERRARTLAALSGK